MAESEKGKDITETETRKELANDDDVDEEEVSQKNVDDVGQVDSGAVGGDGVGSDAKKKGIVLEDEDEKREKESGLTPEQREVGVFPYLYPEFYSLLYYL